MSRLIGMIHLGPLPGSPRYDGDLEPIITAAMTDAAALTDAGFDELMVENFGDAPFHADDVPKVTVAAMTRVVTKVQRASPLPLGVNVLRNDALAAVAVAAATGATAIRVNVLTGTMFTDQGAVTGRAAAVARARAALAPDVEILADVFVKHATPPPGLTIEDAARDTFERGGAHALVVSGAATGAPVDAALLARVRKAVPAAPLLIGSGVTPANAAELLAGADGAIVGSSIKVDGLAANPIDPARAAALVAAVR